MNIKNQILICAAPALLAAGIMGHTLYARHVSECKEAASQALRQAVSEEVTKRTGQDFRIISDDAHTVLPPENKFPLTTYVASPTGTKEYVVTLHKSNCNISNDPNKRAVHSTAFREQPLDADTLAMNWNSLLRKSGFDGAGLLRIDTDIDKPATVYAGDSACFARADSLTYLTIGHGCELELTALLAYRWWQVYAWTDWVRIFAILAATAAFAWLLLHFRVFRERYLTKTVEKVVEKTIVKEVPVSVLSPQCPHLHRFNDGAMYDKDTGVLKNGEAKVKFTAIPAAVLCHLIEADGKIVPANELKDRHWNGQTSSLYITIKRLRDELAKVTSATIENKGFGYRLNDPEQPDKTSKPDEASKKV